MKKTITIITNKQDYEKVMNIISAYACDCVSVTSLNDKDNEIQFTCSIWKFRRCAHDLNLAMALGVEIEVETL